MIVVLICVETVCSNYWQLRAANLPFLVFILLKSEVANETSLKVVVRTTFDSSKEELLLHVTFFFSKKPPRDFIVTTSVQTYSVLFFITIISS